MCFFHLGHSQISCKWWLRDYPMGVTQKSRHLNISWTNILLPHDTITSCPSHYHRFSVFIDSMGIGEQMMERKATDCDHLILLCPKVHGSNLPRLGCWDSLYLSIIINHVWRLGPSLPWTKWVFPPFDFFFWESFHHLISKSVEAYKRGSSSDICYIKQRPIKGYFFLLLQFITSLFTSLLVHSEPWVSCFSLSSQSLAKFSTTQTMGQNRIDCIGKHDEWHS
jgi:hypothetical protein